VVQRRNYIASIAHVVDDRMNALQRLVAEQRQAMTRQYYALLGAVEDMFSMTSLLPVLIRRTSDYSVALVHMNELRQALLDAMHGRLDTFVIGHDDMTNAMQNINAELQQISTNLLLAVTTTAEAFQITDITVTCVRRDVYVTIKFPLTPVSQILTLYDVISFPVLMPDNSPHSTALESDIVALAYQPTADYSIEFHSQPPIENRLLYMNRVTDTFRDINAPSCILALFRNSIELIKHYCSFILLPYNIESSIVMLDESTVLFTNVSNVTRVCLLAGLFAVYT